MGKTLNATEMRQFVEALEKHGLIPELARKVTDSDPLARVTVRAMQDAAINMDRYPGIIESV